MNLVDELYASDYASALTNRAARHIENLQATIDLIYEEARKNNAPLGRSDSAALYRIREILDIPKFPELG